VAVEHCLACEIEETRAEGETPLSRHDDRVAPERLGQRLAVDRHDLKRIGVDVEDVVAGVVVDHGPLLDRAEANRLVDPVRIEPAAIDQVGKLLVRGGRGNLRFDSGERDGPRAGDLVIADGREW
jgi:hypothetical protein